MPRIHSIAVALVLATPTILLMASSPQAPSTSLQPGLPSGHPSVSMPKKTDTATASTARPEDVQSIEGIVDAYYASVSGPKGQPRDWSRFLSLFMPDARFILSRSVNGRVIPLSLSPEEFVKSNSAYFERGGYFETDIHRDINAFGHIAQVFSTYASRRALEDPEPYARGINSFQLMNTGDRWWITTIMWDSEQRDTNPIPPEYLPATPPSANDD